MSEKKFPWGCVLAGCGVMVLGTIVLIVGFGFWTAKKVEQFEEDLKDPEKQRTRVMEILGAESLPEGLHPMLGMSIPFLADIAVLGDSPTPKGGKGELGDQGFVYVSVLADGDKRREMQEMFEGKRSGAQILRDADIDININSDALLGRGEIPGEDQHARWVAYRGRMEKHDSLVTMLLVECPDADRRLRIGIWFSPDTTPQLPIEELDLSGTIVDQTRIEALISHFHLCGS